MKRRLVSPALALFAVMAMVAVGSRAVHADPRDFTLINGSPITVTHFYVSPSDQTDWGDDILGQDTLAPGESVLIYFTRFTPDSCQYDVRVVYQDGSEGYLYKVNLCETDTVTAQ